MFLIVKYKGRIDRYIKLINWCMREPDPRSFPQPARTSMCISVGQSSQARELAGSHAVN